MTNLDRFVEEVFKTNMLDYWLDICARCVAICDREEAWCREHGTPVPVWVAERREQYMALDEALLRGVSP